MGIKCGESVLSVLHLLRMNYNLYNLLTLANINNHISAEKIYEFLFWLAIDDVM